MPGAGRTLAVIPEIGAAGMAATWLEDIRTWPAPQPEDDGISLLSAALKEVSGRHGRIGVPLGHETHLRMPAGDFRKLADGLGAPIAGTLTLEIVTELVDEIVTVTDNEISAAMASIAATTKLVTEPAGAAAVAALQAGRIDLGEGAKVVALCSGANVDLARFAQYITTFEA